MASHRFPILLWGQEQLGFTACLVEDGHDCGAFAASRTAAVAQIKELLRWRFKKDPDASVPNFKAPQLRWIKVEVRPEYTRDERIFALRETVTLRVPCVHGKDSAGSCVCAMPTLNISFSYDADDSLESLVTHYVQVAMKGRTPQDLARCLPPPLVELDDVVILVANERRAREKPPGVEALAEVAEPFAGRSGRSTLAPPWERDALVARLVDLLRQQRSSIALVGESGCGKTAILAEAARKIEREGLETPVDSDIPDAALARTKPRGNRFWLTSATRLIAGMRYLGQWQERCERIIEMLDGMGGILCIENLLELVKTGGTGPNDSIAAFLIPYLQRGELRLVAEATPAELDACYRLLPAFSGALSVLDVPALSATQSERALAQLADSLKQKHRLDYDPAAAVEIVRLFGRFMPYQSLPGRAAVFTADLFQRAQRDKRTGKGDIHHFGPTGAQQASSPDGGAKIGRLLRQHVIDRFIELTGLPELFLRDERLLEYEEVVATFSAAVIGQDPACRAAAGVVTTFKAGLNDPARPLGVMLFCGPTGVGKTELARQLSEFLFGHGQQKDRMLRLDMSEYAGPGAVERLLGAPDGEPSELIKRMRQQPFTVLLLDEIEKAAPEVFDVLMGVFDEGRLTDRYGRLTTFRSALIVMTSNLGSDHTESFGLSRHPAGTYQDHVMDFFRPEFFNRIDAVVTFAPLSPDTVRQIAVAEMHKIAQREGLLQQRIELEWDDAVLDLVCRKGYDVRYGARPLQRTIEAMIVTPLAHYLLAHPKLKKRKIALSVGQGGGIEFG